MQDSTWVSEALAGSADSFACLIERYERPLYAFVLERTRNRAVADDLVQETFVRAYEGLARYDRSQQFINWLMGIAAHVTAEWQRRQERHRRALDTVGHLQRERESEAWEAEEPPPPNELQGRVLQALAGCPERYRMPLMLRFIDRLDYQEIAETLELSPGQVKGLLYRGTQMLREALSDLGQIRR